MTSIDPINVNTQGVNAKIGFAKFGKPEPQKAEEGKEQPSGIEQKPVSADKVLEYMSANAAYVAPKKTVNPAKYVDSESAKRIASFMAGFEDKVAEGLKAIEEEFGEMNLPDEAKLAVVLAQINKEEI